MELPTEIWSCILQKTRTMKSCNKLYTAFPSQLKAELKEIYETHKEKINIKIICSFEDKLSVFNNSNIENPEFEFELDSIFTVRYIKNWDTNIGKKDCIIAATKTGLIMFWDAHTKEYIQGLEIGVNISEIEFHPTKSLMLTVGQYWIGRELKIWKFDSYWSIIRIDIECLGDYKKLYYFDPILPYVYTYSSNDFKKISKIYICNYDIRFPSIMNGVESFIYLSNYYEPINMNKDGTFECIKNDNGVNFFCKFRINNFEIEEIQLQPICKPDLIISDFIRIGADIYFHTNCLDYQSIYKQTEDKYNIIYKTVNKISKILNKNNLLLFLENEEYKCIDLDNLEIESIFSICNFYNFSIIN
jgi:hypothetical protein